eukprot:5708998-Lingulodinium_polyedra.AAC.1
MDAQEGLGQHHVALRLDVSLSRCRLIRRVNERSLSILDRSQQHTSKRGVCKENWNKDHLAFLADHSNTHPRDLDLKTQIPQARSPNKTLALTS